MRVVVDSDYAEGLAAALVALEAEFEASRPEVVVAADDSEAALAAALVATKLLIPFEATAEATASSSPNGRVIAQLAASPA